MGATVAALNGLGVAGRKNLVLIAGGQGKDQDFAALRPAATKFVKQAYLFGEDGGQIESVLHDVCETMLVHSLDQAVTLASSVAEQGDTVLLSPACASFDMFSGFEERGRCFQQAVAKLPGAQQAESGGQLCS